MPFKCNLQRYVAELTALQELAARGEAAASPVLRAVGVASV